MLTCLACFILALTAGNVAASGEEEGVLTNLELMRKLARNITARVLQEANLSGGTTVQVSVLPKESAWYIEHSIAEVLNEARLGVVARQAGQAGNDSVVLHDIEFGLSDAKVNYTNLRKEGLFGSSMLDRGVRLRLTVKVTNRRSGGVLLATELEETRTDTIELSAVSQVENPAIAITKGIVPREGFLSGIVEPLIIIGSVAVAVVLLFSVRS